MRPHRRVSAALFVLATLLLLPALRAQDEPRTAGTEGVPVPKKIRHVQPVYPPEAQEQGIRGIVILELVLDTQGRVSAVSIIRSVPGLDEAALAAARQWEYEVTKVEGKPVSVRLTVPITFTLKLPDIPREPGIPELRQGALPRAPGGTSGRAVVVAEITLDPDGRIGLARVVEGEMPWSDAVVQALRTWRFAPPPPDVTLSFRLEAAFSPGPGRGEGGVQIRLRDLRRSAALPSEGEAPEETPAEPAAPASVAETTRQGSAPATGEAGPGAGEAPEPAAGGTAGAGSVAPSPAAAPPPPAEATAATTAPATTAAAIAPPPAQAAPTPSPAEAAAPPPVEVITAPPPPLPPENGVSAIRDVTLEPGVPDLVRGRRPVAPPFARMARAVGTVEVAFSVGAGGTTAVQSVNGPDVLKPAAEQTVASWVFRRVRADRIYLLAALSYDGDRVSVVVRPQPPPP